MEFQNAYKGIAKIYLAEILQLIGIILLIIGAAVGTFGMQTEGQVAESVTGGLALGTMIALLPGVILPIVSLFFAFFGLRQASQDEPTHLRTAFTCCIIAIVLPIVGGIIKGIIGAGDIVSDAFALGSSVASMLVTIYTISGIGKLMARIGRNDLVNRGNQILWLLVAAQLLEAISRVLPASTIATVIVIAGGIFSIVMYVMYLGFLRNSRTALAA